MTAGATTELLAAARGGSEDAFRRLFEPYRGELHAHCYRMLGSVHDAEDALQEASLRAWRGLPRFEGRSSLRSWLYTIATNACLTAIERRPKRVLPVDYGPASDPRDGVGDPVAESIWIEPYPNAPDASYEQREGVELAFIAALQHLPATQRAVLILREVLSLSAREVADALETTVAAVNSALQRARKAVDERLPERTQQATLRALGDDRLREIVEGYMDALQRGDVDAVVGMLAKEAVWAMPPLATWFVGDELPEFLRRGPLSGEWRWAHRATTANGQPAVGAYTWDAGAGAFLPFALDVITLDGDRIASVTAFIVRAVGPQDREFYARWPDQALDPVQVAAVFERFGLPARIDESAARGGS